MKEKEEQQQKNINQINWSEIKVGLIEIKSNTCDAKELEAMVERLLQKEPIKDYLKLIEVEKEKKNLYYTG